MLIKLTYEECLFLNSRVGVEVKFVCKDSRSFHILVLDSVSSF